MKEAPPDKTSGALPQVAAKPGVQGPSSKPVSVEAKGEKPRRGEIGSAGRGRGEGREAREGVNRRPPLPHDALRAREPQRPRGTELDYMGLDPRVVERGEIRRFGEQFPTVASIFTWGMASATEVS